MTSRAIKAFASAAFPLLIALTNARKTFAGSFAEDVGGVATPLVSRGAAVTIAAVGSVAPSESHAMTLIPTATTAAATRRTSITPFGSGDALRL